MEHGVGKCSCPGHDSKSVSIKIETPRPKAILPEPIRVAKSDEEIFRRLIGAAKRACEDAYQPYSQYSVGAAVLTFDGRIYTGFNIENCGYSQTIHAEESAITCALSDGLLKRAAAAGVDQFHAILAVAVFAPKGSDPWPCCNCRQFMGEFGYGMHVIGEDKNDGTILCLTLDQLVPFALPIEDVLRSVRGAR